MCFQWGPGARAGQELSRKNNKQQLKNNTFILNDILRFIWTMDGMEWILMEYDYFKRCWPARPAPAGFFQQNGLYSGSRQSKFF